MSNAITQLAKVVKKIKELLELGGATPYKGPVWTVNGQAPDDNGNTDLSYMAKKANVLLLHYENIAPGTDIHTITEPGFYSINGVANLVNAPASVSTSSGNYWGQLEVNNLGGFISHQWLNNNGQFAIETWFGGQTVWTDWREVTITIIH